MIIYGSYAIKHWFPDYYKAPKDIDIVVYDNNLLDNKLIDQLKQETNLPIEITLQDEGYFFKDLSNFVENNFLNPTGILSVKMSHAMYDYNLDKTINDIIFLQKKGVTYDINIINLLRKHWKDRYKDLREKMDFNLPPEKFFNSSVVRYVDHDELHDILKLGDIPAYQKILENNVNVKVSKEKFDKLTYEEKIFTFIEEISVLACERYFDMLEPRDAFIAASQSFLTRMTSGWYNIFLLENIEKIFTFDNQHHFNLMSRIMKYLRMQHYNDK
jgi:hypothetical protein